MKTLLIDLGLPKSASTTRQRHLFPRHPGYLDLNGPVSNQLLSELKYQFSRLGKAPADPGSLKQLFRHPDFDQRETYIISQEMLTRPIKQSAPFLFLRPWKSSGVRRDEHPVIPLLKAVELALPQNVQLLTSITLRAQATFLPSLAAQWGVVRLGPVISSFVRRKDSYLFWDQLVLDLQGLRGSADHLTLFFEDGFNENALRLVDFLTEKGVGSSELEGLRGGSEFSEMRENRRQASTDKWKVGPRSEYIKDFSLSGPAQVEQLLGRLWKPIATRLFGKQTLRLTPRNEHRIRAYCEGSNERLGHLFARDLSHLGY